MEVLIRSHADINVVNEISECVAIFSKTVNGIYMHAYVYMHMYTATQ